MLIDLEGHGREEAFADVGQLHALPDQGLGYGLLRYLNPETASQLSGFAGPQIGFNHLGRFAALAGANWSAAAEAVVLGGGDPAMPLAHVRFPLPRFRGDRH